MARRPTVRFAFASASLAGVVSVALGLFYGPATYANAYPAVIALALVPIWFAGAALFAFNLGRKDYSPADGPKWVVYAVRTVALTLWLVVLTSLMFGVFGTLVVVGVGGVRSAMDIWAQFVGVASGH